jgi:hypothetical protein
MWKASEQFSGDLAAVFEFDGEASYFYLYNTKAGAGQKVVGAIYIANGAPDFTENDVEIRWSFDESVAGLFIHSQLWAAFDSAGKGTYGGRYHADGSPEIPSRILNAFDLMPVIAEHELRNSALQQRFTEKRIDLDEPRMIECHFWAWTERDAANLANSLEGLSFRVLSSDRSEPAEGGSPPWNVEAEIRQSIRLTMRREFTEEPVRLAHSNRARYDGWGTHI